MREGLAREFPGAVRALTWTRTSMFKREPPLWATVSAIGAGFLVTTLAQVLVRLGVFVFDAFGGRPAPFTLAWLPALLGTTAAVAIALRAGGRLSVALYLVYITIDIALHIPGAVTFCERSGAGVNPFAPDICTPLGFLASYWVRWSGIGLGLLLSQAMATPDAGRNFVWRVAGTYAAVWSIAVGVWSASVIHQADAAGALTSSLMFSVLAVAAGVAAGVVAARSDHRVRAGSVVALFLLVPWLTVQVPLLVSQIARSAESPAPPEFLPAIIVGALTQPIAAAVLVLAAAVTDRQRFVPRDSA
jgi:hypothetical protein